MGAIVCRGSRTLYEENGRIYRDDRKLIEFDPETLEEIKPSAIIQKTVISPPPPPIIENKCDICGFPAKSNAGLAVHKLIHKTSFTGQEIIE